MGYSCSASGRLFVLYPFSDLFRGPPDSVYLRTACHQHCSCQNIAPGIPSPRLPTRAQSCNVTESVGSTLPRGSRLPTSYSLPAGSGSGISDPQTSAGNVNSGTISGSGNTQTSSECTHSSWDEETYKVRCSEALYGRPSDSSCYLASLDVVARAGDLFENREFLGMGVDPSGADAIKSERTPQTFLRGKLF